MVKDFEGKHYWALILGGSSGLGLASAKKLARHGMNICVVHRDARAHMSAIQSEFEKIKSHQVQFLSFNLNAMNPEKRTAVLAELQKHLGSQGKVRALVHSIAKGNLKPVHSAEGPVLQNDDFHLTIDAMAISLYDWVRAIHDNNMFSKTASVISFTSEGNTKALKNYAAVSAAKAALEAITRSIALEMAPLGIRANCIQAGFTDTPSFRMIPGSDRLIEYAQRRNPSGRLTTPDDVAAVVYLLCREEAAWINGAVIPVDGGEGIV